jgi:hypothetical protein
MTPANVSVFRDFKEVTDCGHCLLRWCCPLQVFYGADKRWGIYRQCKNSYSLTNVTLIQSNVR